MVKNVFMLTTLDNPFNPFTQYDEWYSYDVSKGYNTCAYLARVALASELDEDKAIDQAIDDIVKVNVLGNYIKVNEDFIVREVQALEV